MKTCFFAILIPFIFTVSAFATVSVSRPSNGDQVSSPVQFVATGTTHCSKGVASMGIYVDTVLQHVVTGNSLNTSISMDPGTRHITFHEWDNCGGTTTTKKIIEVTNKTGVFVTSPANNSDVSPTVNYTATAATSSCPQGVSAMGVYVDSVKKYVTNGTKLDTQLKLRAGRHDTTVKAWDYCGGATGKAVAVNVQAPKGKVFSNLQAAPGWIEWGQLPPDYAICTSCRGDDINWAMYPHQKSPSLSGNSTRFSIYGSKPYSDILWDLKLIGVGTALNIPDTHHEILPQLHHFTYDADVYITDAKVTQALEFDVDLYPGDGVGMIWGIECDHLNTGKWKLWDNNDARWEATDISCPVTNGWHHLTFEVERKSNNDLLFKSITWAGKTHILNKVHAPFKVPKNWYGLTIKYQLDGDHKQHSYTTYVDNLNIGYW